MTFLYQEWELVMAIKDLIFFSNPFGYGPTAKAIAVLNECKKLSDVRIYYIAANSCLEIFDDRDIEIINADQRDYDKIYEILSKFTKPYIISSLNKFSIKAAKKLHYHNCFIDSLTWMWNPIPKEYLDSEIYFALNFPGVDACINQHKNIMKIPYIIDKKYPNNLKPTKQKIDLLINIGGCENPLTQTLPTSFLNILAAFLNTVERKTLVVGGARAINYIKNKLKKSITCTTLSRPEMNYILKCSSLFMTTPGLNATLEAFYYKIPTVFLMPTNLSQWKNLNTFIKFDCGNCSVRWEDIIKKDLELNNVTEKSAIAYLEQIAKLSYENTKIKNRAISMLNQLTVSSPCIASQSTFIQMIGTDGAEIITQILQQKWDL